MSPQPRPVMPGVPEAGHVTSRGFWHHGSERGCVKCAPRPDAGEWRCWRRPGHRTRKHEVFGWPLCADCRAKPPFHERFTMLDPALTVGVYVPAPDATGLDARIAPGSGIVGVVDDATDPRMLVHYEGWVHDPGSYADLDVHGRWQAGVEHAAQRMVIEYPTAASARLVRTSLVQVGEYQPTTRTLDLTEPETLARWLPTEAEQA